MCVLISHSLIYFSKKEENSTLIKNESKTPIALAFKNEVSSFDNFQLTPNKEENPIDQTKTTSKSLDVGKLPLACKEPLKPESLLIHAKPSKTDPETTTDATSNNNRMKTNSENFSFKSSSEFIDTDKTGDDSLKNRSKQTTPPSECYYYLVKPRITSAINNENKNETNNQNKLSTEKATSDQDDELKHFLESCFDQLSKNNMSESPSMCIENDVFNKDLNSIGAVSSLANNSFVRNSQQLIENPDSSSLSQVRKQLTVVEKLPNSNETSNTFVLNGETLSDLNDFYSLKITFV